MSCRVLWRLVVPAVVVPVVVVLLGCGLTVGFVHGRTVPVRGVGAQATVSSTAPLPTPTPSGPVDVTRRVDDALLTAALAKPFMTWDRDALLATITQEPARGTAALWWQNVTALGATSGYAYAITENAATNLLPDAQGNFGAAVRIGFATPFDPVTPSPAAGDPDRPAAGTMYKLGLRVSYPTNRTAEPQFAITSWQNVDFAPWDGPELYVASTDHTRVGGFPADRQLIDATARSAEAAFTFDRALFDEFDPDSAHNAPTGAVLFAAGGSATYTKWFFGATTTGGPGNSVAITYPQIQVSPSIASDVAKNRNGANSRTARIVITDVGSSLRQSTLAHEMVHMFMQSVGTGNSGVPRSAVEGYAEWFESLNKVRPNSDAGSMTDAEFGRTYSGSNRPFDGVAPTTEQIYGANTLWYYHLSASIFQFIAADGDSPELAMRVARAAYLARSSAFAALAQIRTAAGQPTDEASVQAQWAAWVRATLLR